jgi:hypothetical protein
LGTDLGSGTGGMESGLDGGHEFDDHGGWDVGH